MDASFDASGSSGLGGVLINMSGEQLSFFSTEVGKRVLDAMMSKGHCTILQELEMMAVLGALIELARVGQSVLCGTVHRQRGCSGLSRAGRPMRTVIADGRNL